MKKTEISQIKKNIMGTTSFNLKIEGMRKPQDFIVYPIGANDDCTNILIQSDKRIARLNLNTGIGRMSQNHSNGAYGVHLSMDVLIPFQIDTKELEELKNHIFKTANKNAGTNGIVTCDNSGAINVI
jgi:hypothetical protein